MLSTSEILTGILNGQKDTLVATGLCDEGALAHLSVDEIQEQAENRRADEDDDTMPCLIIPGAQTPLEQLRGSYLEHCGRRRRGAEEILRLSPDFELQHVHDNIPTPVNPYVILQANTDPLLPDSHHSLPLTLNKVGDLLRNSGRRPLTLREWLTQLLFSLFGCSHSPGEILGGAIMLAGSTYKPRPFLDQGSVAVYRSLQHRPWSAVGNWTPCQPPIQWQIGTVADVCWPTTWHVPSCAAV